MSATKLLYQTLIQTKINPVGLAIFRICYATIFFLEVLQIFKYKELYFDPLPFINKSQIDYTYPLLAWMLVLFGIIIGYRTKWLVIANYVFTISIIATLTTFEYHMHYIYTVINFLMIFLPVSNVLSIDSYLDNSKKQKVSKLYYYLPIFFGIGLIYFDSIFYKFKSEIWINGLGFWLPSSVPQMIVRDFSWLLDSELLVKGIGYYILVFEAVFIFLMFNKKYRLILLFSGILLHLGILLVYPIPLFALGVMCIYLLMVPVCFWKKIPLFNIATIDEIDQTIGANFPNEKRVLWLSMILILFQLNVTLNFSFTTSKYAKNLYNKIGVEKEVMYISNKFKDFSDALFGIAPHGVFTDYHFTGTNPILAISFESKSQHIFLPLTNKNSFVNKKAIGPIWANWGFRVNSQNLNYPLMKMGIPRYVSFWAHKNGVELDNSTFTILSKNIDPLDLKSWEKGYLRRQVD
ncbi:MAG: HTTM domain-containing protein, partial [Flavobacteriaceae bacterium]|nr:HTTM domain-containing protein [Flavobacteriaceae bacterium]